MKNFLAAVGFLTLLGVTILGIILLLIWSDLPLDPRALLGLTQQTPVVEVNPSRNSDGSILNKTNPLQTEPSLVLPTQAPTPTPIPDPVAYRSEVIVRTKRFADSLSSLYDENKKLQENPQLLNDPEWRDELRVILDLLVEDAQALGDIQPVPAEYQEINDQLRQVGPQAEQLRENYLHGIETGNQDALTAAGKNMQSIIDTMRQVQALMVAAGWE